MLAYSWYFSLQKTLQTSLSISLFLLLGFLHCTKIDHAYFLNGLDKPLPEVTDLSVNRGLSGITLTWKSPASRGRNVFNKVLILKSTSAILDRPKPWSNYPVSTTMGASRVVYNATASTFTDTEVIEDVVYFYKVFVSDTYLYYNDGVQTKVDEYIPPPADSDGDGLIEIHNLTELHNIRYNLAGTSYKTSATQTTGNSNGCPPVVNGSGGCNGYELTQDLNFDKDGDGTTWSGDSTNGYTLDPGDNASPHFIVADGGWKPVGEAVFDNNGDLSCITDTCFNTIFEGNGHTITGLAVRRSQQFIGMFGSIGANAKIRNIDLNNNLADYTGSQTSDVGGLVGFQQSGSITTSYATGSVDGGDGADNVGGLVGTNSGSITNSYATGSVDGGNNSDSIGGLVGQQNSGSITASYATGAVNGGDGPNDIGGLVGSQNNGSITGSYATGSVNGGEGTDFAGGLLGSQNDGSITASYATGSVNGGEGTDFAGGLLGNQNDGSITASYATGSVDGGDGADNAGGLVGQSGGSIIASYGFGAIANRETPSSLGVPPTDVSSATGLTLANTPMSWNDATKNTKDAWNFGTSSQIPALKYADYDGVGTTGTAYYCDSVPPPTTGTPIPIPNCGILIPRQR